MNNTQLADEIEREKEQIREKLRARCTACGHPEGWHYKSKGSCLECGCMEYNIAALRGGG